MKPTIDSPRHRLQQETIEEKTARVLAYLDPVTEARVHTLVHVLRAHTPFSYVRHLSPRQLAAWARVFLQFIEERRQPFAVRLLPLRAEGHALLLTNCPDAPFLLDSVQLWLTRQGVRHQVISHPLLSVRRRGGAVQRLEGVEGG
ncbi:MAG: hypothetical protein IH614_08930, partial [Desulfuromonadales bacterium]|nr:hypothetical protein [Desulfuromonadales bacterium]